MNLILIPKRFEFQCICLCSCLGTWEISEEEKRWLAANSTEIRHDPKEDIPESKKIFELAAQDAERNPRDRPKGIGFCHRDLGRTIKPR